MTQTDTDKYVNKYIPLDLVGTGGMAEVYRCKLSGEKGFEKIIVLKKLLPKLAQNPEIVTNFIDEARLAALMQHENIAHIYDFGEIEGKYFIAMEYLFGKDLHTVMQRARETKTPMKAEHALLIASKICEAMAYAHSLKDLRGKPLNIIHRDLTPHNIFITYEGKVKIIDFGIAKAELFDNLTKAGMVKGKVSYMSPEQLIHEKIDLRSDIFSIGILLYEMLSNRRMYCGDTATLIRKCMKVEYQKLEDINMGLQPALYKVLHKALHRDREKRYCSCESMGADIEDCLFSLIKRPSKQILRTYIRQLFSSEFSAESDLQTIAIQRSSTKNSNNNPKDRPHSSDQDLDKTISYDSIDRNSRPNRGTKGFVFFNKYIIVTFFIIFTVSIFQVTDVIEDKNITISPPIQLPLKKVVIAPEDPAVVVQRPKEEPNRKPINVRLRSESKVDNFLEKAKESFAAKRLTKPRYDSAYNYYKKVLEIEPNNGDALYGLHQISEKYAEFTEYALNSNNFTKAEDYVSTGLSVSPQNRTLVLLQDKLAMKKQQIISTLTEKGQKALANNELIEPENDCAFKYFSNILAIDNQNRAALGGLETIGDRFAAQAEDAYRNVNIKKAQLLINKGLTVVPEHRLLLELQTDLKKSKLDIFWKNVKKSFKTLLD